MRRFVFYGASLIIIGVLVLLALPNFQGAGGPCSTAFQWHVRHGMSLCQAMLETYAVDWNGRYPMSLDNLIAEAKRGGYFKLHDVPKESCRPLPEGETYQALLAHSPHPSHRGAVYVDLVDETRYYLYGTDYEGRFILRDGRPFVMTGF